MSKTNSVTRTRKPNTGSGYASQSDLNSIKYLFYGLTLVLFIGFAGLFIAVSQMMIDSLNGKRDSTYELQKKIDEQDVKIDDLIEEVRRISLAKKDDI